MIRFLFATAASGALFLLFLWAVYVLAPGLAVVVILVTVFASVVLRHEANVKRENDARRERMRDDARRRAREDHDTLVIGGK